MNLAYLILAHNGPNQLLRLIHKINRSQTRIFVHLDAKSNLKDFQLVLDQFPDVVFLPRRIQIHWAGYSMLKATFWSMEDILDIFPDVDFIHLMSGADYPIQSIDKFHEHLTHHLGHSFLEWRFVYGDWEEAIPRIEKYHLVDYPFLGSYRMEQFINWFLPKRKIPMDYLAVGRSQWMTLCKEHVVYLLSFLKENPLWEKFMRLTWGPDEFMIQTILFNSFHKPCLINDNLRYIDWSAGMKNPKILGPEDWSFLDASGKFFARKFDENMSRQLLDKLDNHVLK